MRSEIRRIKLAEIAAPIPNAIAAGPFGSNLVSRDYVDFGVPVIRGQNLAGRWVGGEFVFVSPTKAEQLRTNTAKPGDIVFTQRGTLGQVAVVPASSFDWYVVSQSQMKLTVDPGIADARYVYYACTAPDFVSQVHNNAVAAGVPHINLGILRGLEIPLPAMPLQVMAADVLSALDDRIDLLRQTNATLESIAQALFKSWFIDFDPVRAKAEGREPLGLDAATAALFPAEFEASALGVIPKGWTAGSVGDLLMLQRGFDLPAAQRTDGPFTVFAASGPHGSHHEAMVSGPGVTTGRSGVIGRVFFSHEDFWPLNTSLWVKEFKRATPAYAFQYLQTMDLNRLNAGSAVPTLNRNHVHAQPAIVPPAGLVERYTDMAMSLLHRVRVNDQHAQRLSELRDTLLPRLISGKLRLPEAQEQLEDALT